MLPFSPERSQFEVPQELKREAHRGLSSGSQGRDIQGSQEPLKTACSSFWQLEVICASH